MIEAVDLNADMGEGFGPWRMGDDAALLGIVTSANIACGLHAGDPDVMLATMRAALARGVGLGAHPGFADLQGFGRRRMTLPDETLANLIRYQIGAAQGMARAAGGHLSHVKLHGALANMVSEDMDMALVCYRAVQSVAPDLVVVAMAATAGERAARQIGLPVACEIYADRGYGPDATLLPRGVPGAVLHDPGAVVERVLAMLSRGGILAWDGRLIATPIHTICLHGDTPGAVELAAGLRHAIAEAGIALRPLSTLCTGHSSG